MGSVTQQGLPAVNKDDGVFGKAMRKQFPFDPEWTNFNHGSYGSMPKAILAKLRGYQDECEAHPDLFIRYTYPKLLDESREAVASIINAPPETVVFVANATVGVNTVFRNLHWNKDGKDVVLIFSTVYEGCGKVVDYIEDYYDGGVTSREIPLEYPVEDDEVVRRFRDAVAQVAAEGKRARIAIFDVVSSRPGVACPWEALVRACRELGVLSMVDGAQGVGMARLDMRAADPDFFVSNCHKWLHVPRGCALLYCPRRNQALLPTTLATSHGYVARRSERTTPLPRSANSPFVQNFEHVGTVDNAPYLCVKDAIRWRAEACGGEEAVRAYLWALNKAGSDRVAAILGTPVMENSTGTLREGGMANVALPIWTGASSAEKEENAVVVSEEEADRVMNWMLTTMIESYKTFITMFVHGGRFWVRLSAQVYLDEGDYEWAGKILGELVERVRKREYL